MSVTRLYVEIRGPADGRCSFLHGGPGGPESLFAISTASWSGISSSRTSINAAPDGRPRRGCLCAARPDLDHVVDRLRRNLAANACYSSAIRGSVLGTALCSARPDSCRVSLLAPVCLVREQYRREYAYDLAEATSRGDERALADLREIGPPPYPEASSVGRLQRVTERYRGVEFQSHNHALIVLAGLAQGLVTPGELMHLGAGIHRSLNAMHQELSALALASRSQTRRPGVLLPGPPRPPRGRESRRRVL